MDSANRYVGGDFKNPGVSRICSAIRIRVATDREFVCSRTLKIEMLLEGKRSFGEADHLWIAVEGKDNRVVIRSF